MFKGGAASDAKALQKNFEGLAELLPTRISGGGKTSL